MSTTTAPTDAQVAHYFRVLETVELGDHFEDHGIDVTVNSISHSGPDLTSPRTEVLATSDGRFADRRWHEGLEKGEPVYYVILTPTRRFHGWIDSISRRVIQTG